MTNERQKKTNYVPFMKNDATTCGMVKFIEAAVLPTTYCCGRIAQRSYDSINSTTSRWLCYVDRKKNANQKKKKISSNFDIWLIIRIRMFLKKKKIEKNSEMSTQFKSGFFCCWPLAPVCISSRAFHSHFLFFIVDHIIHCIINSTDLMLY